jgi:outer membrane immunogenic protein
MRAKLAICVGVLLASATHAFAADMPAKVYTKAPVVPIFSWTGFYVGGQIGYIWGSSNASAADTLAIVNTYGRMPKPVGVFGGVHSGYNVQLTNQVVVGVEGNIDGLGVEGLKDTIGILPFSQLRVTTDWAINVVARFGYAINHWLPYVFAGPTWVHDRERGFNPFIGAFGLDNWHNGVTAGAGIEYAFTRNWSARAQYRYINIDRQQYNRVQVGGVGNGFDI